MQTVEHLLSIMHAEWLLLNAYFDDAIPSGHVSDTSGWNSRDWKDYGRKDTW